MYQANDFYTPVGISSTHPRQSSVSSPKDQASRNTFSKSKVRGPVCAEEIDTSSVEGPGVPMTVEYGDITQIKIDTGEDGGSNGRK